MIPGQCGHCPLMMGSCPSSRLALISFSSGSLNPSRLFVFSLSDEPLLVFRLRHLCRITLSGLCPLSRSSPDPRFHVSKVTTLSTPTQCTLHRQHSVTDQASRGLWPPVNIRVCQVNVFMALVTIMTHSLLPGPLILVTRDSLPPGHVTRA